MHAPRQIARGFRARPKAAPLQALGKLHAPHLSRATTSTKADRPKIFSFGKAHALRYFWNTTVNTSSTLTLSARPSAGLFSVYFFYFWWGSNSF